MAVNLEHAGINLVSSARLIQRLMSLLDGPGIRSHKEAADHLYSIVETVWRRIGDSFATAALREGDVQQWILDEFKRRGLITDHPPIVAAGLHSADPHYATVEGGKYLEKGEVLQLDMWAKLPEGIFADISWVGVLAAEAPPDVEKAFRTLVCARDGCVDFINSRLSAGIPTEGREVDAWARDIIGKQGYARFVKHRTGHSIDTQCHGSGVNLDSIEFPDSRALLEGSCFSVEPGIYTDTFGLRTEINVYIKDGRAVISGGEPQNRILTLAD